MALFSGPQEHAANPPESWLVVRVGRGWRLTTAGGTVIGWAYRTKGEAEAAKTEGPYFNQYRKEGDWYAGLPVPNWKPYKQDGKG